MLESIDFGLRHGQGYPLSYLRDTNNGYSDKVDIFSNRDIRLFLEGHYDKEIKISKSSEVNKSAMVYLNSDD